MRTKNRPIEVLAPAGSMECLKAAILNGADAVYLGGEMFGARAYAGNFNKEELLEAIDYVHLYGKKLFLTVNTLMKEEELPLLPGFLKPFYEQGLDAVIVQDLGAVSVIRKHFPKLEIHASTQMTITGVHGARIAKKMGAKRVVPARELSLEEIQEIKDDTGLDMECFVHGALCYCYSGQCFMSSMLGGRSGNRGRCAGTCRLPFYLDGTKNTKNAYPLSLKDLCTIEHLPEILDHGVDSLKIEGRMKGPRYVGEVTRIYRKYVDLYLSEKPYKVESEDMKILMEVFNRGGFTGGYYKEYHGKDMMSMKRPDHQGLYVGKISKLMKGKISFTAQEDIHKGDALQIRINSEEKVELTKFEITNTSDKAQTITSTVAIPMYARSASNIRDHRHVTSLLYRTFTVKNGIMIYPTLTFDERGHNKNKIFYGALAKEEVNGEMVSPVSFCPVTEEFIGRGGNFENPYYVVKNQPLPYKAGEEVDGYETVAAIRFADCTLEPGETRTYIVALGYGESEAEITELSKKYLIKKHFDKYLEETKEIFGRKKIQRKLQFC